MDHARAALAGLWSIGGLGEDALDRVDLTGPEEFLPSVFRVGAAAVASTAAATLAVRELASPTLPVGRVSVDGRHAAIAFRSERHVLVDGAPPPTAWGPLSGYYRTRDGWIQLHCNFAHHEDGVVAELGVARDREALAAAIATRGRLELEDALAARGMCAAAFRSPGAWSAHPQGAAVAGLPLLEIERIDDAPPVPPPAGDRPLAGVRVLDLTRIIAGPVATRFLAAHGATVLRVGARHLPVIDPLVGDVCMGKLATDLDLRDRDDRDRFLELVRDADVVVQGYRPGGLEAMGLGPRDLAEARPGLVYASLSAYGHDGPWSGRRGFDSLVQTASGIGWVGMEAVGADGPRPLPAQALDHASGYLLAYGVVAALQRRAAQGGSWFVRGSLAQTGHWITGLGRRDGMGIDDPGPQPDLMVTSLGPRGRLDVVAPVGSIAGAPPRWDRPAPVLGSSPPEWP